VNADAVKAWIASRRLAEQREWKDRRSDPISSQTAIASALALIALDGRLHGWPREDEVSEREDNLARQCWDRVRDALRRP
jgi:hypothetical protein